MKSVVTWTTGLMFLLCGTVGAFILKTDNQLANQNVGSPAAERNVFVHQNETADPKRISSLQLKENSHLVESPPDDSALTRDFSVSEPVTSSSGPAPTEAPMPRAGWIGLAGVLCVMAARWFSAARRPRAKSAAG
jgi:hypothetical protein